MVTAGVEGGVWDRIDEFMTLPRYMALTQHWAKHPPVHVSAAALAFGLGVLKQEQKQTDRGKAMAEFEAAGIQIPGVKRRG